MKISVSETIHAPVEIVFETMTDFEHAAERISGIAKLEILGDPKVGPGFRWRETRVMFGKEATEEMEITEFNFPNSYRVEAASHGTKYESELTFTPVEGGTDVTMTFSGVPQTLAAKLTTPLAVLFAGSTRKALRQDILDLKRFIEDGDAR